MFLCDRPPNTQFQRSISTSSITVLVDLLYNLLTDFYFACGGSAKYCAQRVCMSVCLSVRSNIPKTTHPNFTKFLYVAYSHGLLDGIVTRYVLLVLWMMSFFQ